MRKLDEVLDHEWTCDMSASRQTVPTNEAARPTPRAPQGRQPPISDPLPSPPLWKVAPCNQRSNGEIVSVDAVKEKPRCNRAEGRAHPTKIIKRVPDQDW